MRIDQIQDKKGSSCEQIIFLSLFGTQSEAFLLLQATVMHKTVYDISNKYEVTVELQF